MQLLLSHKTQELHSQSDQSLIFFPAFWLLACLFSDPFFFANGSCSADLLESRLGIKAS